MQEESDLASEMRRQGEQDCGLIEGGLAAPVERVVLADPGLQLGRELPVGHVLVNRIHLLTHRGGARVQLAHLSRAPVCVMRDVCLGSAVGAMRDVCLGSAVGAMPGCGIRRWYYTYYTYCT